MPLVFTADTWGNLSIIGAPGNLMGVNALEELGLSTSFFMYAPIGIPMLICGIIYFIVISSRLLPDKKVITEDAPEQTKRFQQCSKMETGNVTYCVNSCYSCHDI